MKLLTVPNANQKIAKGLKYDHATYILHFSPHTLSGVMNVCPMATIGCIKACLNSAGRGGIYKKGEFTNVIQQARIRKTRLFHSDKVEFFNQLIADVKLAQKQTARMGKKLSIRLNGTSDIVWERKRIPSGEFMGMTIFEVFPDVQWYDYTKIPNRKPPSNYHLTFSNADGNSLNVIKAITADMNIAVVFRGALPTTWRGLPVISGDDSDLRFLDLPNHIIGLTAKGKAKKDTSGFVV
jgi:hypothetical protein